MRTRWLVTALAALAGAAPALAGHAPAAPSVRVAPAPGMRLPAERDSFADRMLRFSADSILFDRLHLAEAVMEQSRGNLRGMIRELERIDYSPTPVFDEADRAAFLLGHGYLESGRVDDYLRLAERVSHWSRPSVYTTWIAYHRLAALTERADSTSGARDSTESAASAGAAAATQGGDAATALAASLWIRSGRSDQALELLGGASAPAGASAVTLCLRAAALAEQGADNRAEWTALATADTTSTLGRDLAGLACIQLAGRAIASGADATALLEGVPAGSRYEPRARQMLGLIALEAGQGEAGTRLLASALRDSAGGTWREVAMALAGHDLDQASWESAAGRYRAIDQDWNRERDSLSSALATGSFDRLWAAWKAQPALDGALIVDELPGRMLSDQLARASTDLTQRPAAGEPPLAMSTSPEPALGAPPAAEWERVMSSERALADAEGALEARRWALGNENDRLAERRRYLGAGDTELAANAAKLLAEAGILSSLGTTLDSLDARLKSVRDQEQQRAAARAAAIHTESEQVLEWMRAMRRLYVTAPDPARARAHPAGYPAPDSVLDHEESMAVAAEHAADTLAARTPAVLERSYLDAWRPGLIERETAVSEDAVRTLDWAHEVQETLDSTLVASWTSPALDSLKREVATLEPTVNAMTAQDQALHDQVARAAVERAVAALDAEREGIDYGLAAASYGAAVHLSPADTAVATPAVVASNAAHADSSGIPATAEESDDSTSVALRSQAIASLKMFLERHPQSAARGEMRFRLADLELIEARRVFREQMAAYMKDGGGHGAPLPVLTHTAALKLYQQILDQDAGFPHLDAVLFDAGMILADEGDPGAAVYFQRLVTEHASSPYVQEAYLRMGDIEFNDKRFASAVPLYQSAAGGADPTLSVMALYKLGWAQFNQDRFGEAAAAFGAVLDRYQGSDRAGIRVDIEGEARTYLVFSLAGAGGAPAFAKYFDGVGEKPYERAMLVSLSDHFRRYAQYPQAIETDELFIRRYANDSDALIAAQRLLENHLRANRPADEEAARLELAPHFAPGSDWAQAQTSDSTRTAGASFAKSCWMSLAFEHHRRARDGKSADEWRQALELYRTLLAHWPEDPEIQALELNAGEASAQLGDFAGAMSHYDAAAKSGVDSLASQALLQRVAVTDRWYESSRRQPDGALAATGSDSLAKAVIEAGDTLLAHDHSDPHGADIVWRQSQLALAHGWHDLAAQKLDQMILSYPADPRTALAASQKGDALFHDGNFEAAGAAFESALEVAKRAGRDSLARHDEAAIPVSYFRMAEVSVSSDSSNHERHAELFLRVATRWPSYEYAHVAQYRAALAYLQARKTREAVDAFQGLIDHFPRSEYVRDAHLEIARTWEAANEREKAADAYLAFAAHFPADSSAKGAQLMAGDLLAAAGLQDRADQVRSSFVRQHPEEIESDMDIMEDLARRELGTVGPGHPLSALLPVKPKTHAGAAAAAASASSAAISHLAAYLELASKHPKLASRAIVAQVRYLEADESRPAFEAAKLTQPLPKSLRAKQKLLDSLVTRYKRAAQVGVPEWSHASAFRIGQALVGFGETLEGSERPADLKGDDLRGYEDVLLEQAQAFYEKGEGVWSDLLKKAGRDSTSDTWLDQARSGLFPRLAKRFFFRPEVDFPLVAASPADRPRDEGADEKRKGHTRTTSSSDSSSRRDTSEP